MRYLSTMANYNTWVNGQYFDLCARLSDHEYRLDRQSFFGSIHNTLNHILVVDILWMARLRGWTQHSVRSLDQILHESFDDLRTHRVKQDKELVEFVSGLKESDLSKPVTFRRMGGEEVTDTVEDMLATLFNHQTHHRGQIHTMLTQSGLSNSEMPDLDVVVYLRKRVDSDN